MRAINDRVTLELLLQHRALTRTQLAGLTGLSKPTATQLLQRLAEGRAKGEQISAEALQSQGYASIERELSRYGRTLRVVPDRAVIMRVDRGRLRSRPAGRPRRPQVR